MIRSIVWTSALVAAAVAGGCGGASHRPVARPVHAPPRPVDQCRAAVNMAWKSLRVDGIDGAVAARVGRGRLGIVFADDSNDDPCSWSREAGALASRGYAVAVFKAGGGDEARQAVRVAAELRKTGPSRIVLIGASVGARAVLQAGTMRPSGVSGLVALSAERRIRSNPTDLLPQVRRVRLPVLSVGSRGDGLTTFGRDTRAFDGALRNDRMLLVGGDDHGVDLLSGRHGRQVHAAILRFLRAAGDGQNNSDSAASTAAIDSARLSTSTPRPTGESHPYQCPPSSGWRVSCGVSVGNSLSVAFGDRAAMG